MMVSKWKIAWLALCLGLALTACTDEQPPAGSSQSPTPPSDTGTADPVDSSPSPTGTEDPTGTDDPPVLTGEPTGTGTVPSPDPSADPSPSDTGEPDPPPEDTTPLPPPPPMGLMAEGEPVDESWFADAVFIGDSRTDGLKLYAPIPGATYLSYKGLSVFGIESSACITLDGERVTVLDALSRGTYAKVFILLGVNELGYQNLESFRAAYSSLVAQVKEIQPDAVIYLQLQPPVNEAAATASGLSSWITNERVQLFNEKIALVAEEHGTALVDLWEALADETGSLPAALTSDGVHMRPSGYTIWYDYLRSHTGTTPPIHPAEEGDDGSVTYHPIPSGDPAEGQDANPGPPGSASPELGT